MCCLELPLLILGIFYIYKLAQLGSDGLTFNMPPDALQAWRGEKRMQYIWGAIAVFGSFVIGVIGYFMYAATTTTCARDYYYNSNSCGSGGSVAILLLGVFLAPLIVLIVGFVLAWMASSRAKAIQMQASPTSYGMPGGYPVQGGWPQQAGGYPPATQSGWPQQPGAYPPPPAQPGAYPPPTQGGWPQQPGAYPPPSGQPGAYPPPPSQPGDYPPPPPVDPQAPTGS